MLVPCLILESIFQRESTERGGDGLARGSTIAGKGNSKWARRGYSYDNVRLDGLGVRETRRLAFRVVDVTSGTILGIAKSLFDLVHHLGAEEVTDEGQRRETVGAWPKDPRRPRFSPLSLRSGWNTKPRSKIGVLRLALIDTTTVFSSSEFDQRC